MPARSRLVLAGGLTLLAGLVLFFPARLAYQWFAPPELKVASIDGSVWTGSAGEASVAGVYLRDLRWRLRPLSLLTGRLSYSLTASPVSGFIDGNVAISFRGRVSSSALRGALPLDALQQAFSNPGLTGSLSVQLGELQIKNGVPLSANGSFDIVNLRNPRWHRNPVGGYRAQIFTQEEGVIVSVEETDGVVDIDGRLQISADGSYEFVALLLAKANTPPNIRQAIEYLPFADDGVHRIYRFEGRI